MPSVTTTIVTAEVIFVPPPTTAVTILPGATNGTPGITFPPLMDIKFDIEAGKALGVIMIGSPPQIELLSGNEKVKIAWGVRNVSSNETGPFKIKFLVNGKQSGDVINVESLAVGKTYDYEVQLVLPKDSKTEITVTVSSE